MEDENIEASGPNYPGKNSATKSKSADEDVSFSRANSDVRHFSFELGGKTFDCRELSRESVGAINRRIRELGKMRTDLQAKNRRYVREIAQCESRREAQYDLEEPNFEEIEKIDNSISSLQDEQQLLADNTETILTEQTEIYTRAVLESVIKWPLPSPVNEESVADLTMTALRNIGDKIIENSMAGGDAANFTKRKSQK